MNEINPLTGIEICWGNLPFDAICNLVIAIEEEDDKPHPDYDRIDLYLDKMHTVGNHKERKP